MLEAAKVGEAGVRRYWREADARVWVDTWRRSGQTRTEFAVTHGISVERLSRWARRLGEMSPKDAVRFHPVRVEPASAMHVSRDERIELELGNGCRARLPRGFDAGDLRRVLDVLGGNAGC